MPDLPPAYRLIPASDVAGRVPLDRVVLGYDERFLRRKRLMTAGDQGFMVDLPETTSVAAGDCFELMDGRLIEVRPAEEPVLIVTGDLPRLAWHIGNRHTPCQIEGDRLVIRDDHVLKAMLVQLGARVLHAMEPFTPEGGAYGHGRTMGHEHLGHEGGGHVPHVFTLSHAPVAPLHVQRHVSARPVEDEPEVADE
jgi:urease accessory protein